MREHQADVVCVGAGLGGLSAAVRAHDLGRSVVVVEASEYVGGGAAYSGGLCWLPGVSRGDSLDAAEEYLAHAEGERGVGGTQRSAYLAAMRAAAFWCSDVGIDLEVVPDNPDVYYPIAPGSLGSGRMFEVAVPGRRLGAWRERLLPSPHYRIGLRHSELYDARSSREAKEALFARRRAGDVLTMGSGLAAAFVRAALVERDLACLTGHRVTRLLMDGNRVAGVVAETTDGPVVVRAARGVVLATGGYGWAPDAADLEGLPDFAEAGPPSIAGDHLALAAITGAAVVRGSGPQFSMGAVVDTTEAHPGTDRPICRQLFDVMGLPHTLVVNRQGERFGDESYYVGINEALRAWDAGRKLWRNFPCFLVVDDQFRTRYPFASLPAGSDYPDHFASADNLRDLAVELGIDPDGLDATVDRFNEHARRGEDPDFGRGSLAFVRRRYGDPDHLPNANLGPLEKPPFHAVPLRLLGTGMCTFGLANDSDGRVLRRDGSAVPGLFVTGNAAATTEFRGYITGYANSRNLALGYAAGSAV